jgi:hypothetical protein
MIRPLIMVIRLAITQSVTALPLEREFCPEIEVNVRKRTRFGSYLDGRNSG